MADDEKDLDDLETSDTEVISDGSDTPTAPELKDDIDDEVSPPVAPPLLVHEYHEHDGRRWLNIAGLLIAALIVAALIVLLARSIYRHYHHPKPTKPPVTQPPVTSPGSGSKPHKHPSRQPNTAAVVPNTGPGDTVRLFVEVAFAAAALHYVVSLRRAKNSN